MIPLNLIRLFLVYQFLSIKFDMIKSDEEFDKPLLQEIFVPRNLNENQTIKLNCDLVQGKLPIVFEWYFNNEKLKTDNRIQLRINEDFAHLVIKQLSIDDNGDYYCLATSKYGNHKRHASVYVNSKPKFIVEPKDIISSLDQEIDLKCDVKSYPKSEINWIKLPPDGQKIIKKFDSNHIKFNLNKDSAGYYKCVATNLIGSIEKTINVGYFSKYELKTIN